MAAKIKTNKRAAALIAALLLFALCFSFPAHAASNELHSVDITVELRDDGSAHVTEVWSMYAAEGTEMYLVQSNLGEDKITNLAVSDETGAVYQNIGEWDVDRSFEQKAKKCGLVTKYDGYELCWGLGSYGEHTFTVQYDVSGVVVGYDDYCGFNRRFVNDDMTSSIESAAVTVLKDGVEFTSEEVKVWAFGFYGQVWVKEGAINAYTEDTLNTSNYLNVMARFPREMFTPERVVSGSFDELRKEAFIGSDYSEEDYAGAGGSSSQESGGYSGSYDDGDYYEYSYDSEPSAFGTVMGIVMGLGCPVVFIAVIFLFIGKMVKSSGANIGGLGRGVTRADVADIDYWREVPYGGALPAARFALSNSGEKHPASGIIGAYLLRWARAGAVQMTQSPKRNIFGKDTGKLQPSITFTGQAPDGSDGVGLRLFNMMRKAAKDEVLQSNELEKWMGEHYDDYFEWLSDSETLAENNLLATGELVEESYKVLGIFNAKRKVFTPLGKENIRRMLGFKKFLKDFTIINEREPYEVGMWDEYLVFAALFGIADEVAEQFKDIYPQFFNENTYYGSDVMTTLMLSEALSRSAASSASAARSRSSSDGSSGGGGGFSSGGGGGGFSGGGSGGGVR